MVEANESTDKQDEIDHIMQEIEQLQSEMGTAVQESVPAGHDATLADIHLPVEKEVEKEKESDFSKLSMNLQGKMTLQLNYAQEHSIVLNFSSGAIQIQLSNGTEFKIPLIQKPPKKAA